MKKTWLLLIGIFLNIILFSTINRTVQADVDYDIKRVNVDATVNSDGSLSITRKIEYDFDSSAHGVYYRQNLDSNQKISNEMVTVQANNGKKEVVSPGNGTNNTYQLTKDSEGYQFKVFHNISSNSRFTVTYAYTISNAVINWKDTAELNFKIIGNGWDTDLDNVHVKLTIDNGKSVPNLKAWAHGQSSGYIEVSKKKGQIILEDSDVPGDVGIELHTIFPTSITSLNKNVKNKNNKQAIITQEKKLAGEANRKRARQRLVEVIISFGTSIAGIVVSFFLLFNAFKSKKMGTKPQKMRNLPRNYDIPKVNAVGAQILDKGSEPNSEAFTAYITALAGKNRIKIEKIPKKRKNYQITIIDEKVKDENELLAYLFDYVGNGKSFTTRQMRRTKSSQLSKKYRHWRSEEFDKVVSAGYIDEKLWRKVSGIKTAFLTSTFVMFVASILLLAFLDQPQWPVSILWLLVVLDLIGFIYFKIHASFYTQIGAEMTNRVRGFKKMIKDIGNFKMRDVGELIFWEEIMPYAVAFDLSDKVIDELHTEFSDEEIADSFTTGLWIGHGFGRGFTNSFTSSFEHGIGANSSSSGGSGGFSGGSSGGFGGGSGGGAF
ncbi:DUF2207 domain-containing protein [Lactobacillus sp.]|uniref:DUF2207 domain-containing protein n=1 Tax=Lactobacillus sp. TaxID=1591 RepID=UPI0019BF203C|nr:DUF2207 domain-containing protein [Lactobacillus sp.]MBD5429428.1 DUF2207 domain-containing protein [Lactobacillus sp.]